MNMKEYSFLSIFLKPQIFILLKIGRNEGGGDEIKFNDFFY